MKKNYSRNNKFLRAITSALICVSIILFSSGCSGGAPVSEEPSGSIESSEPAENNGQNDQGGEPMYVPNELVGSFETEKEALKAADLYGIELVSFSYGIALFRCEGDPEALIKKGQLNGWPELSLNHIMQAF